MRRWLRIALYAVLAVSTLGTAAVFAMGDAWGGSAIFLCVGLLLAHTGWKAWRAPRDVAWAKPAVQPPGLIQPIAWGVALVAYDVFIGGGTALLSIATVVFLATFGLLWALAAGRNRSLMLGRLRAIAITSALAAIAIAWGAYDGAQAERRVLAAAEALKAFSAHHGRYPDQLAELVPAFLPEPPYAHRYGLAHAIHYRRESAKGPLLMYVSTPPFGSRALEVETGNWSFRD